MGTLRDEAYEKLDYLSQLTEVVIAPQNEVLAKIPDRVELSFDQLNEIKSRGYRGTVAAYEISIYQLLANLLTDSDLTYINDILLHFKFEVSPDFVLDIANQQMTGHIALVKTVQQIEEKEILQIAVNKAVQFIDHYAWPTKRLREKIATILNTLEPNCGTEWAKRSHGRVSWADAVEIKRVLSSIILDNKWRIRDTKIILKIGSWINSYLKDETDQSVGLVNLLKLKIMVDKDLPIYSVDEVINVNTP